jgi:hypothetical protein
MSDTGACTRCWSQEVQERLLSAVQIEFDEQRAAMSHMYDSRSTEQQKAVGLCLTGGASRPFSPTFLLPPFSLSPPLTLTHAHTLTNIHAYIHTHAH